MKLPICALMLALLAAPAMASGLSCEELRDRIAAKLEGKKVPSYSLEIVDAKEPVKGGRVVGTCEMGSKKIVYTKG